MRMLYLLFLFSLTAHAMEINEIHFTDDEQECDHTKRHTVILAKHALQDNEYYDAQIMMYKEKIEALAIEAARAVKEKQSIDVLIGLMENTERISTNEVYTDLIRKQNDNAHATDYYARVIRSHKKYVEMLIKCKKPVEDSPIMLKSTLSSDDRNDSPFKSRRFTKMVSFVTRSLPGSRSNSPLRRRNDND